MQRLMMVTLWPAFLVAIVAEGFFFSMFDPADVCVAGIPVEMSPMAVYTIGFLFFWGFSSLASLLTCYLVGVPNDQRQGRAQL